MQLPHTTAPVRALLPHLLSIAGVTLSCPALPPQAITITSPHPNQSYNLAIAPQLFSTKANCGAELTFPSEGIPALPLLHAGLFRGVPAAAQPAAGEEEAEEEEKREDSPKVVQEL